MKLQYHFGLFEKAPSMWSYQNGLPFWEKIPVIFEFLIASLQVLYYFIFFTRRGCYSDTFNIFFTSLNSLLLLHSLASYITDEEIQMGILFPSISRYKTVSYFAKKLVYHYSFCFFGVCFELFYLSLLRKGFSFSLIFLIDNAIVCCEFENWIGWPMPHVHTAHKIRGAECKVVIFSNFKSLVELFDL